MYWCKILAKILNKPRQRLITYLYYTAFKKIYDKSWRIQQFKSGP